MGVGVRDPDYRRVHTFVSGPPRCGTNWLTYIVQTLLPDKKVRHCHTMRDRMRAKSMMLILRNPKEACLRHVGSGTGKGIDHKIDVNKIPEDKRESFMGEHKKRNDKRIESIFENNFAGEPNVNDYLYPIIFFDSFSGQKMLIYYEDLITNPKKVISGIAEHLGTSAEDFLNKYEWHKEESIKGYENKNFKSVTRGNKVSFHSDHFPENILKRFEGIINKQPENVKKYIAQYTGG